LLREPTPGSTTDDDELSSTDAEWMYPESPPPLAPLGLPLRGFDELQFDSASERRDDDDTNMIIETTLDAGHDIEETHADTDWYTVTNLIQAGPIAAVNDAQPASEPDSV
jgi:hypothetical protein